MYCDFNLCVYQQDGSCLSKDVCINGIGVCDSAVVLSFPDAELEKRKVCAREELKVNLSKITKAY